MPRRKTQLLPPWLQHRAEWWMTTLRWKGTGQEDIVLTCGPLLRSGFHESSSFQFTYKASALYSPQDLNISVPSICRTTVDWRIYYTIQLTVCCKQRRFSLSFYIFLTTSQFYSGNIHHFPKCPSCFFSCNTAKESKNKTVLLIQKRVLTESLYLKLLL